MAGSRSPFLKSISLEGFLSFGPGESMIPLLPLNVLIGPNGAGKSNLVEAISVLRAVPRDLPVPFRKGGGVRGWLWGGAPRAERARISITVGEGHGRRSRKDSPSLQYSLTFGEEGGSFVVLDERLENELLSAGESRRHVHLSYGAGKAYVESGKVLKQLSLASLDRTQSILSQRKGSDYYAQMTRLAASLDEIRIYRSWTFGPEAVVRESSRIDDRNDRLSETFDNLPARLAVLKRDPNVKKRLLQCLRELAPGFDDLEIIPEGGRLQLYLAEGSSMTSAYRLSDGTLKFLCLLAILLDPSPPLLMVIEEPELGLHPDTFPFLHDLLVEASQRCQLIVTTHSVILLDSFTEQPESILVVDRHDGSTVVSKVQPRDGEGLGSRWLSGELGGTRW